MFALFKTYKGKKKEKEKSNRHSKSGKHTHLKSQ